MRSGMADDVGYARSEMEALLAEAEELAQIGSWALDLRTSRSMWSDGMYRIHGLEPGSAEPGLDTLLERTHPEDREGLRGALNAIVAPPASDPTTPIAAAYRAVRPDGMVRHVRLRGRLERDSDGVPARWTAIVRDVTEERLSEREVHARYALTHALREWESFDEGVMSLLRRVGTALDFPLGGLWIWAPEEGRIFLRAAWSPPVIDAEEFDALTRGVYLRPGEGFVGRVWVTGEPVQVPDLTTSPDTARRDLVDALGVRSELAFAARGREGTLAVLSFYAFEPREPSEGMMLTLKGVGEELGQFLEQRRADLGPRRLTDRELEVLGLAAEGYSGPQIAERLFVSPATVKTHFEHIYEKLGVGDRAAAVAYALRTGLIR
jgi:PAS domain S-box-containing protein